MPTSPVNVIRMCITAMRTSSKDAMTLENDHRPITTSAFLAVGLLMLGGDEKVSNKNQPEPT